MMKAHRYLPALVLSAGVLAAAPACASYDYYGYQRGSIARDVERRAYDSGYREGIKKGDEDSRRGRAFSFQRHDDWRDADDGYHRDYGDREFYRRVYRRGFETGYSEAFNRSNRGYGYGAPRGGYGYPAPAPGYGYPSNGAYSSPAERISPAHRAALTQHSRAGGTHAIGPVMLSARLRFDIPFRIRRVSRTSCSR